MGNRYVRLAVLSGGVQTLGCTAKGMPLPVCGSLQLPVACSPNPCAYRTPSLVPPTPVLIQGSTVRIRIPFAAILSGHVCGGNLYMHQ